MADMQQFIQAETAKSQFQNVIHDLNEKCWDTCVEGKPSNKLDGKTESCLKNCVERFIDTNMLILQVIVIFVLLVVVKSVAHFQRFERKAGEIASSSGGDF